MKRKENSEPLKELLKRYIKAKAWGPKLTELKIIGLWEQVVGKPIMKHTKDIQFRRGTLFVKIDSSVVREELHYAQESIITKINEQLEIGELKIQKIILQ